MRIATMKSGRPLAELEARVAFYEAFLTFKNKVADPTHRLLMDAIWFELTHELANIADPGTLAVALMRPFEFDNEGSLSSYRRHS